MCLVQYSGFDINGGPMAQSNNATVGPQTLPTFRRWLGQASTNFQVNFWRKSALISDTSWRKQDVLMTQEQNVLA